MSREGKIKTKRGSSHNHFENYNPTDKYLSTTKSEFRNAYEEQRSVRHGDVFTRGYDSFGFKTISASATPKYQTISAKRGSMPATNHAWPSYTEVFMKRL